MPSEPDDGACSYNDERVFVRLVQDDGDELRTITAGTRLNGTVFVKEESQGALTEFAYGAEHHITMIEFAPIPDFDESDVKDILSRNDGDISDTYLTDIEDACELWEVPYDISSDC